MPQFMDSVSPITELFVIIFLISIVFGLIIRKTQFCPLGGVADYLHSGNSGRLWMYFFAIATAMFSVSLLEFFQFFSLDQTRPPYRTAQFQWPAYLIGGLLFGIGMALCRGCGMRSMVNLAEGNFKALIAMGGMSLSAVLMLYTEGFFDTYFLQWVAPLTLDLATYGIHKQDLGSISHYFSGINTDTLRLTIGLVIASSLIIAAFRSQDFRANNHHLLGGLLIGILVTLGYVLTASTLGEAAIEAADFMDQPQNGMGIQSYTFIRPMGDVLYVLFNPETYLITFGMIAFLGVGVGSFIWSLLFKEFNLQWVKSPIEALRYFVGGIMVGIGGILGMGCTLGQGIAGTSTLSTGSFIDLFALLLGAYIGIKAQKNFMQDHCHCP